MGKSLIVRVIMLADCSVHIAVQDGNTFECTPEALLFLLSDPYGYIEKGADLSNNTCRIANTKSLSLPYIKGLTLIKVYSDTEIVCVFPKVFKAILDNKDTKPCSPINLSSYIATMDLSDEKHYLMKFFCEFNSSPHSRLVVKRKLNLDPEVQSEIVTETINAKFFEYKEDGSKVTENLDDESDNEVPLFQSNDAEVPHETITSYKGYIKLTDFIKRHNLPRNTAYSWFYANKLAGAVKVEGQIIVPENTPIPMRGRNGRQMPPKSEQGIKPYEYLGNDYTSVQEYIKKRGKVSDELRRYIRTYEEFNYYVGNRYREVNWNGRPALIIDIDPGYYCKRKGFTNRELIKQGKSPVDSTNGEPDFHLHHIGQKKESPFCIISQTEHSAHYSDLHDNAAKVWSADSKEDLHGPDFEADKIKFWAKYLEEYDAVGNFRSIRNSTSIRSRKPVTEDEF